MPPLVPTSMSTSTDTRQRVAVVIYEDAAKDLARAYRGLMTAVEFLEAGDDVTVVYDGSGVDTLAAASTEGHQLHSLVERLRPVTRGACAFCVKAHGVGDAVAAGDWSPARGVQAPRQRAEPRRGGLSAPVLLTIERPSSACAPSPRTSLSGRRTEPDGRSMVRRTGADSPPRRGSARWRGACTPRAGDQSPAATDTALTMSSSPSR